MDLNEIFIFAKVVEHQSFVAASREIGMPKTTVSRKVSELETRLGARLLHRTTRQLSLTEIGQIYYRHAARIAAEIEEAELTVDKLQDSPRGTLRVTIPIDMPHLEQAISSFLLTYPEVRLELHATSETVDLIQQQFDVGIRVGDTADSSFIARKLFDTSHHLVASPDYLSAHPTISKPNQLNEHACLALADPSNNHRWVLSNNNKVFQMDLTPRCTSNNFSQLVNLTVAGLGIAMLPAPLCQQPLDEKTLQIVLPEWSTPKLPVQVMYHSTRHLSPKIRAFIDHIAANVNL